MSIFSAIIADLILFAQGSDFNTLIGTPIVSIGGLFVGVFLAAGITHIFGKMLHYFEKGFTETFVATSFGYTFVALFGWLTSLNLLSAILESQSMRLMFTFMSLSYSYFAIIGQQNVNSKQAFMTVFVPQIILYIITIVFAGAAYLYISGLQ